MSTGRINFDTIQIEKNRNRENSKYSHVIHSRDRNLDKYPLPSKYEVSLNTQYTNVLSISLNGSLIPKREPNVNTQNNVIPFNLEDFITGVRITNTGRCLTDGVYTTPDVTVSAPSISGGTNAEVTVTVSGGYVTGVTIDDPGSGYLMGSYGNYNKPADGFYKRSGATISFNIPFTNFSQGELPSFECQVGTLLIARLTVGQYDFAVPNDFAVGLCREVTRSLQVATQEALDSGLITAIPGGATTGAEYWPYASGADSTGSCWLWTPNANASENSNVAIQRGQPQGADTGDRFFEILFGETEYKLSVADTLLGMGSSPTQGGLMGGILKPVDQTSGTTRAIVNNGTWASAPVKGVNNYDLTDYPKMVIINLSTERFETLNRVYSVNDALSRSFATLVFDANSPDTVFRSPAASPTDGTGNSNFSSLLIKPGTLKGIKGNEFDTKKVVFKPQVPQMEKLYVEFRKLNGDFYDFQGADHTLFIEFECDDNARKY